jgi:hypothetical protein
MRQTSRNFARTRRLGSWPIRRSAPQVPVAKRRGRACQPCLWRISGADDCQPGTCFGVIAVIPGIAWPVRSRVRRCWSVARLRETQRSAHPVSASPVFPQRTRSPTAAATPREGKLSETLSRQPRGRFVPGLSGGFVGRCASSFARDQQASLGRADLRHRGAGRVHVGHRARPTDHPALKGWHATVRQNARART